MIGTMVEKWEGVLRKGLKGPLGDPKNGRQTDGRIERQKDASKEGPF